MVELTEPIRLASGGHSSPEAGMCFNEAAAFLAGEPFSDAPPCVSPVIRRFGMTLNDRLDDERRQLLRPFVLRALGTAGDGRDEERRRMCTEWLIDQLPPIYERAGLVEAAAKIRALKGDLVVENLERVLYDVRDEAWKVRQSAVDRLRARLRPLIEAELKKRGLAVAVDVAADADAAADAAVAVAVAVDVDVAAAVDAAADAAIAAAVAADADADAIKYGSTAYWKIRDAVYNAVYDRVKARAREVVDPADARLKSALDLLDKMLPEAPLRLPAVPNAAALLGLAA